MFVYELTVPYRSRARSVPLPGWVHAVPATAITPRAMRADPAPSLPSSGRLRIASAMLAADPPPVCEEDVVGATQTIAPCSHMQHM